MKKLIILLIIILGLSLVAYAGGTKVEFFQCDGAVGEHINASGFAIINETPEGDITTVVQIQVRDAAANFTYYVRTKGVTRGSFTTNINGSGKFHINLTPEDISLGNYITIRSLDETGRDNIVLVYPEY